MIFLPRGIQNVEREGAFGGKSRLRSRVFASGLECGSEFILVSFLV